MYESLEQALNTKQAVVVKKTAVDHKGATRYMVQARKAKGKKIFYVVQYENGMFSSAA